LKRPAAVIEKYLSLEMQHQRRVGERHEYALRTVLEIPAAARIRGVIPADEFPECRVADSFE